jgi:hypothetical protein
MTTIVFWVAIIGFIFIVLNLLPVPATLPVAFTTSYTLIVSAMKAWDFIFPITELFIVFGLAIWLELGIVTFKLIFKIIHLLRGGSSAA